MLLKMSQNSQETNCGGVSLTHVFFCKCCEFFKNTFYIEDLRWLLLFLSKVGLYLNKSAKPSSLPVKFRNCSNPWNKKFKSRRYLNSLFLGDYCISKPKAIFCQKILVNSHLFKVKIHNCTSLNVKLIIHFDPCNN